MAQLLKTDLSKKICVNVGRGSLYEQILGQDVQFLCFYWCSFFKDCSCVELLMLSSPTLNFVHEFNFVGNDLKKEVKNTCS